MQIVIDIPQDIKNYIDKRSCYNSMSEEDIETIIIGIKYGTILPEHGRLGDMDELIIDVMDRGIDHIQTNDFAELCQIIDEAPCLLEPYADMGE